MTTYAVDLRERVVRAYEQGKGAIRQLARCYDVSQNTVHPGLTRRDGAGSSRLHRGTIL